MIDLILKIFIKKTDNLNDPKVRGRYGIVMSCVGIAVNVLLSCIKFLVGSVFGLISVSADAANNLSDAGAQIVSLISFKMSSKPADRDHPFGHARIEYVASMIVSFAVLLVGFEIGRESLVKIFNPQKSEFGWELVAVLAFSIAAKLWLSLAGRKVAKRIDSSVIRATSADSLSDALATSAVLASAVIGHFTDLATDAYMGVAVSVVIMIAGIKILNDTKNSILGSPPDANVISAIRNIVEEYDEIYGIHDMVVHNYGPGNTIASLHAEVNGKNDVYVIHDVIDNVEKRIYEELGVRVTIHMDPIVTDDEKIAELRSITLECVRSVDPRLNIHDFRFVEGISHSNFIFDVSVPFEVRMSDEELKSAVQSKISGLNENFFAVITVDRE